MKTQKKVITTIVALAAAAACAVGGTLAWLADKTNTVTNTFTVGKVDITLQESPDLNLKMIPGTTLTKDPTVTVKAGSEDSYVFVKVEEENNLDTFITYTVDAGVWKELDGVENVYYTDVTNVTGDQTLNVLTNQKVTVNNVTQDQLSAAQTSQPKLKFTAYAIQKTGFEDNVAEAWKQAQSAAEFGE